MIGTSRSDRILRPTGCFFHRRGRSISGESSGAKSSRRKRAGSLRWRPTMTRLVTLVGDVANAYVNLRTLQSRLAILNQSISGAGAQSEDRRDSIQRRGNERARSLAGPNRALENQGRGAGARKWNRAGDKCAGRFARDDAGRNSALPQRCQDAFPRRPPGSQRAFRATCCAAGPMCAWQVFKRRRSRRRSALRSPICCRRFRSRAPLVLRGVISRVHRSAISSHGRARSFRRAVPSSCRS